MAERGINACNFSKADRKIAIPHNPGLYHQRHKIEITFGCMKSPKRIHPRWNRCAHAFFAALCAAATAIYRQGP